MKVKVILTFDYELPLGSVQSYDRGLFEPTDKLLSRANRLNVPIVLFADICSAIQFRNWDIEYYEKFKTQIKSAIKDKHDVQLHIHPHWMDSKFQNGQFIPSPKYGLSDFKEDEHFSIETIVQLAHSALNEICLEEDNEYKCLAFRAGGYNVEPESKRILNALYALGIRFESSVIPGLYQNLPFSKIDYRKAPQKSHWPISKNGPLTITHKSDLVEYPITRMPISLSFIISRIISKLRHKNELKLRLYNNTGKGYNSISKKQNWMNKYRASLNPVVVTFDREYMTYQHLEKIVEWNIKKFKGQDELYITSISHPKSMGDYHLDLMEEFIVRMKEKLSATFVTYKDISIPTVSM